MSDPVIDVRARVKQSIERHQLLAPGETIVVGVSGGADSLCLLHALRALSTHLACSLHAAHLHHGIRGQEADEDARFVAGICQEWGLACTIERADVPQLAREHKLSLEEAARQARYAFLARVARSIGASAVAVAHNADDQVETVLMHLIRGSGLAGLRGMQPLSWLDELRLCDEGAPAPQGRIRLLRPLLEVTRATILEYCHTHGLEPRFDRSNLDQTLFRNRLRHELLPLLETYNPNIRQVLLRTAAVVAGDYALLCAQREQAWRQTVCDESAQAVVFDRLALSALPVALQRSLLREGIHRLRRSLRNIDWVHVEDAVTLLQSGNTGNIATLPEGLALFIDYTTITLADAVYITPRRDVPRLEPGYDLIVAAPGLTPFAQGRWRVRCEVVPRAALPPDWRRNRDPFLAFIDAQRIEHPLRLRARREGDWFVPFGFGHRKRLGDWMTNAKIPRRERDQIPLLAHGEDIVWVVGYRQDERYAVSDTTTTVLVATVELVAQADAIAQGVEHAAD
jgi:tRNA(Ile)-lysidine synthase